MSAVIRNLLVCTGRALYGRHWTAALAEDLRVSERSVRRWADGEPIPRGILADLLAVVQARKAVLGGIVAGLGVAANPLYSAGIAGERLEVGDLVYSDKGTARLLRSPGTNAVAANER
jgi:hypothetical protein